MWICLQIEIVFFYIFWLFTQVSSPCLRNQAFCFTCFIQTPPFQSFSWFLPFSSTVIPLVLSQTPWSMLTCPDAPFLISRTSSNSRAAVHISPPRHCSLPIPTISVSPFSPIVCLGLPPDPPPKTISTPFSPFAHVSLSQLSGGFEGCLPYLPVPIHSQRKGPSQKLPELFTPLKIMNFLHFTPHRGLSPRTHRPPLPVPFQRDVLVDARDRKEVRALVQPYPPVREELHGNPTEMGWALL